MSCLTNEELKQTFVEVARRASVDPAFRTLALQDAEAAIRIINPKKLPSGVAIRFVDNSGCTKVVPLPDLQPGIVEETVEAHGIDTSSIQIGFFPTVQNQTATEAAIQGETESTPVLAQEPGEVDLN